MSPLIQSLLLASAITTAHSYSKRDITDTALKMSRGRSLRPTNTWNFGNVTSVQSSPTGERTQIKSPISGIPTAVFTAIPHHSVNLGDVANVEPEQLLQLAYQNPRVDGPQTIEISTKLRGNAIALDHIGALQSIHCSQDTIRLHFDSSKPKIPERIAKVWPNAFPFFLLTNHAGCQDPNKAQAHEVKSIIWSNDRTEAILEKTTVPLLEALEEMKGQFGGQGKTSYQQHDVTDIPLQRPPPINVGDLKYKKQWTAEDVQNIEDILTFDKTLDAKFGISTLVGTGPQGESDSKKPGRILSRRSGRYSSFRGINLQRRSFWDFIKDFFSNPLEEYEKIKGFVERLVEIAEKVYDALKLGYEIYENGGYDKDLTFVASANDYVAVVNSPWGKAVDLIKLEKNDNLLEIYCVDCEARTNMKLSGHFEFDKKKERYGAALTFDGDLSVSLLIGAHARTKSIDAKRALIMFDIAIGPIEIPGILGLGPNLRLDVGTSLHIEAAGNLLVGGVASFGHIHVGLGLGSLSNETLHIPDWNPKIDPKFNMKARVQVSCSVYADLLLGVEFRIFDWSAMAGMKGQVKVLAGTVGSIDYTPSGWQNYTTLPRTMKKSASESTSASSIKDKDDVKNKKMDRRTRLPSDSRKPIQQREVKAIEPTTATENPMSKSSSSSPSSVPTAAYDFSINTFNDRCQNGIEFSLAVEFGFSFFADESKSSEAKLSLPIHNATCFPLLGGPSKRSLEQHFQVSVDRAQDIRMHSAEGNLHLVYANETNQTFSIDTLEIPDDISEYVVKDEFNQYFTIFDSVKEQGVSRIRMIDRDQYPFGSERVIFAHSDNVTAALNVQTGDFYVPVSCMNELGGLQLFVMSPSHNVSPNNVTEVINSARNPPLVPRAGVTDCVPINLVFM